MDGCRSVNPMPKAYGDEGELSHMLAYMRLEANNYRWRFNLVTGEVREGDIDDLNTEFNKTNPLYGGQKSRYAYHQYIRTKRAVTPSLYGSREIRQRDRQELAL